MATGAPDHVQRILMEDIEVVGVNLDIRNLDGSTDEVAINHATSDYGEFKADSFQGTIVALPGSKWMLFEHKHQILGLTFTTDKKDMLVSVDINAGPQRLWIPGQAGAALVKVGAENLHDIGGETPYWKEIQYDDVNDYYCFILQKPLQVGVTTNIYAQGTAVGNTELAISIFYRDYE